MTSCYVSGSASYYVAVKANQFDQFQKLSSNSCAVCLCSHKTPSLITAELSAAGVGWLIRRASKAKCNSQVFVYLLHSMEKRQKRKGWLISVPFISPKNGTRQGSYDMQHRLGESSHWRGVLNKGSCLFIDQGAGGRRDGRAWSGTLMSQEWGKVPQPRHPRKVDWVEVLESISTEAPVRKPLNGAT